MTAALSENARAFLQGRRFGALATINRNGTPQLTAMWYLLEGDTIVMNTKGCAKDFCTEKCPGKREVVNRVSTR